MFQINLHDETDSHYMLNTPISNYCSVDKVNQMLNYANPKALSVIHCNVRSLTKNVSLLSDLVSTLSRKPDIIGI